MSDDEEYEYDYGSDVDDGHGDEDDPDVEDEVIEIENSFYEGEDLIKSNPEGAIELFNKVIELETKRDVLKWYECFY